jgi:hypothetical protein
MRHDVQRVIRFAFIILGLPPLVFFILHDFHGIAGIALAPRAIHASYLGRTSNR